MNVLSCFPPLILSVRQSAPKSQKTNPIFLVKDYEIGLAIISQWSSFLAWTALGAKK